MSIGWVRAFIRFHGLRHPVTMGGVEVERGAIIVREGKGGKDRAVMLPQRLVPGLREQLARARLLWQADQAAVRDHIETRN